MPLNGTWTAPADMFIWVNGQGCGGRGADGGGSNGHGRGGGAGGRGRRLIQVFTGDVVNVQVALSNETGDTTFSVNADPPSLICFPGIAGNINGAGQGCASGADVAGIGGTGATPPDSPGTFGGGGGGAPPDDNGTNGESPGGGSPTGGNAWGGTGATIGVNGTDGQYGAGGGGGKNAAFVPYAPGNGGDGWARIYSAEVPGNSWALSIQSPPVFELGPQPPAPPNPKAIKRAWYM